LLKATGIVRRVDDLGRIVIPMELRRKMLINEQDPMEIFVEGDRVILKKYAPGCIFCGQVENTSEYSEKRVCSEGLERLSERSLRRSN
jgi:transcriptional pleiotropic regulator of transition state genes